MRTAPLVALAVLVLLALGSVFVVHEGQTAILLQFGRIAKTGYEPGPHLKLPLVQQALKFDKRILTLDSAPERYLTSERKDVNVDFYVKWRINDPSTYYTAVAGDETRAQQRLAPIVKEGLRTAINTRTLQDLVSGARADLTQSLVAESNRATRSLGIEVIDIRIKRIDLPEEGEVLGSVYKRMRAERAQVASELRAQGGRSPGPSTPMPTARCRSSRPTPTATPRSCAAKATPRRPRFPPKPTARIRSSTRSTAASRPTANRSASRRRARARPEQRIPALPAGLEVAPHAEGSRGGAVPGARHRRAVPVRLAACLEGDRRKGAADR
jgi:membrane protease subunit HflC